MTGSFIVVYDACVLYPAPLRDLLMHLALTDLFMAKWTNKIHDEWIKNVLKNRPDLTWKQLERTRNLMNKNALDCLIDDYEHLIFGLNLPDPNDRHVLAAAIHTTASTIVTFNLKDYPAIVLAKYGIEALHPDDFILLLAEIDLSAVLMAVKRVRGSLKNPTKTTSEYLEILEKQSLPQIVSLLREYEELL
jgi:predicted nucleic acid-binding protein